MTETLLLRLLAFGARRVWRERAAIDALNVYPVPDGDTGTNMASTLAEAWRRALAARRSGGSLAETAAAAVEGALLGARGNSGVILSQWLAGFCRAAAGWDGAGFSGSRPAGLPRGLAEAPGRPAEAPGGLAEALAAAAEAAWRAVPQPVEGTILSVARAAAAGAASAWERAGRGEGAEAPSPAAVLGAAVKAAAEALERTPAQLEVLRLAGVVDAGGRGLLSLLEGMEAAFGDEALPDPPAEERLAPAGLAAALLERLASPLAHRFCTEALVQADAARTPGLQEALAPLGDCLLVVTGMGPGAPVRVHIHANDPEAVRAACASFGPILAFTATDMAAQVGGGPAPSPAGAAPVPARVVPVAVVPPGRWAELLTEAGAAVVPAGPTVNPSVADFIAAVAALEGPEDTEGGAPHQPGPGWRVVLLPANRDAVPAARQAAARLDGRAVVVEAADDPARALAAALACDPAADLARNKERMTAAARRVRTGSVSRAARPWTDGRVAVAAGQWTGFVAGRPILAAGDAAEALIALVSHLAQAEADPAARTEDSPPPSRVHRDPARAFIG